MIQTLTCRRCGKDKPPPRNRSTALCLECEAETRCVHYDHNGGIVDDDWRCAAGVCLRAITAPMEGSGLRVPCRFIQGGTPVTCDKFTPTPIEQCRAKDEAWEAQWKRMTLVLPVVGDIKKEHKGTNWSGVIDCPTGCGGQLGLTHAACNGHVWGKCSTEGCVAWME